MYGTRGRTLRLRVHAPINPPIITYTSLHSAGVPGVKW